MTHRIARALAVVLLTLLASGHAYAQAPAPLARLQFDIVGMRLVVDPPALTVPRNIATQINTTLALPPASGAEAQAAIAALTEDAVVEAELRGPGITPTRIVTRAGQPIPLPPLSIPGDYFLDGIRLARNGQTILDAVTADGRAASTIPIKVISEVFVTNVTSRPLSLDEIRERGIVIDQNNFRTVSFQVAFNIDGAPFTIEVPAALPTPEFLQQRPTRAQIVQQLAAVNERLRGLETRLPPQFDRPGLNFSIAALPFFPVPEEDGGLPAFDVPPITGLVVIPGNVAFLNQFFSVLLMVTNVAPDGTPLELRETTGTIVLPTGLDRVPGSFGQPGDDPLRLARIEGIGVQPVVPVIQLGSDGLRNTADDIAVITPQRSGEGEFLVEGLKEGAHVFDIDIQTTLYGLPSGPVRLSGRSAGAVFVRNPTFSVTLAHPRTIRSGEQYDLYATVTNTSLSPANLVSIGLEPAAITGAQLVTDAAVTFETIAPGQAVTARFRLLAQKTGQVTFSSFTGDAAAGGGIQLTTGIDERGVPLAPNAIVLPKSADHLPSSLVAAAQRVLGQAFSIATAPAEALPAGVIFVKRQTVVDRGVQLAQAGERIGFGEPLGRVVQDLLLDWLGNGELDAGFDQILRTTEAGAAWLAEIAAVVQAETTGANVLDYQAALASTLSGRSAHLSAAIGGVAGQPAPLLSVSRALGGGTGQTFSGRERTLVSAATLDLASSGGDARLAIAGRVEADRYRVQIAARVAGAPDLGIVVPGANAGELRQLRYRDVQLDAGGIAYVEIDLPSAQAPLLSVDRNGDGVVDAQLPAATQSILEPAPSVLAVRQLVSAYRETAGDIEDPATYGLVLGVLFDKPMTAASAEVKANYTIPNNAIVGARLQPGGRVAYLYLERPVGALVDRSLTVADVADLRGHTLSATTRPIVMALTDGARVFGQVRTADGLGVPQSVLKLTVALGDKAFDVSTIRTDSNGAFDFDFVPRLGTLTLQAQHPATLEIVSLAARIRGQGEQLLLNPTFQGRGTVHGRVLAPNGAATVPGARVALLPGSVLGTRGFETTADALGEFTFSNIPVGVFTISAADASGGFGQVTGVLPGTGRTAALDVVLTSRVDDGGHVVGRVFASDGATPGAGFTVYVGQYDRDNNRLEALDRATADATGSFSFARTLPRDTTYDVIAVDPATQQIGVARATVRARQTTSVSIVLEAVGAVEGVVFNASGQPLAGALVAGGLALVQTDGNGFFRLQGVPGGRRTIEAGDPVSKRRGSAIVTVVPGQTVSAAIRLESRATIVGRVLDANGTPVPRATVRIPQVGGYTFVFANDSGVFRFPDMPLGEYLIQAPGPSRESLIGFMEANGYDPRSAFTSGDVPPELGGEAAPSFGSLNAALGAYQQAVRTFLSVDESLLNALPMADFGGFGWTKVQLFQDSTTIASDIRFLAEGTVSGRTLDAADRPIGALTRLTTLGVSRTGAPTLVELARRTTDAATGAFSFARVPRFDLTTFQRAGVRAGDFTLEAAHPFSPTIAQFRGQLTSTTPNLANVALRFPAATETNGTIRGRVLLPDGGAAPANTRLEISFGDLTVLTGADGRFESMLPIPAGTYFVTATAPNGLRGRAAALVAAGGTVDVTVQLLGLGATTIVVRRPDGRAVPGALVSLERGTFPNDRLNGTTDNSGVLRFVNVTEGSFSVSAEEPITGLSGRTSGTILRGSDVPTTIVITASGRVTGRFVAADGTTAIPFAQIVLTTGGVRAFATTGADGRFELASIPVGRFTIEGSDPLTGRVGRGSGELTFEGQALEVTVVQVPRGVVRGTVVQSDGTTVVPGATVTIRSGGIVRTELQATTREDGTFTFDGIAAGDVTLTARDPISGFEGSAAATLAIEGEVVERTIALAPFGRLQVTVRDTAGALATNSSVTIDREGVTRTAAVDANGRAVFEFLPLGTYHVVARSLAGAGDGGEASVAVDSTTEPAEVSVSLRGTGAVTVRVVGSDGTTVVPSATVTLNASAAPANGAPGALATVFNGFTGADGVATFPGVPVGAFFVTAEAAALAGVSNGAIDTPGAAPAVTVRLGASGSVAGRVLLPDGITPAAQAIVTLRFTPQSTLQSGTLQVTTGLTGTFTFPGIPVGAFSVSAFEVVSNGVRTRTAQIAANAERVELGDLTLDNAAPRVLAISPADRTSAVSRQPAIAVTFSEPMRAASFTNGSTGNVVLMDGTNAVPLQSLTFSSDSRTVTLRPATALRSAALHTVVLRGGQDGPRDEAADLPLLEPFVSTFTTIDDIAPVVVSASPSSGQRQVTPETAVVIAVSEPLAAATLVLRTSGGAIVPGQSALVAGNSAVSFVPSVFLAANTAYTATLSNAVDLAGNPLAGGTFAVTFTTIDTLAPQIASLTVAGPRRASGLLTITPAFDAAALPDVRRVEYQIGETSTAAATAPFSVAAVVPSGVTSLTVHATAFDEFNNRSTTVSQTIAITANEPPTVTLRTTSPLTRVSQGQSVELEAVASDDAQLARVALSAVGAATFSETRDVPPGQTTFTTRFTIQVPANAPSNGVLTVQAAALDSAGTASAPAVVTLPMSDGTRPAIAIASPVNNAQIVAGQPLVVTVDATDDVGVARVTLACTPALAGCETRTVQPAAATTRQTFTLDVPTTLAPGSSLVLLVSTADAAGNVAQLGRTVLVPDTVPPVLTALDPASGSLRVVAGTTAALAASFTDNVGVTALVFATEGAVTTNGTVPVASLPGGSAAVSIAVPPTAANGATITVRVRARDTAGNLSDERTLTLVVGDASPPTVTFLAPAAGATVTPGQPVAVTVRAADDTAIQRVVLTTTGVFETTMTHAVSLPTTTSDVTFTLTVPAGTAAGALTLAVEAIDAAGTSSGPLTRAVTVADTIAPVVRIASPAAGAEIDPRVPLPIVVEAGDAAGVTEISFAASGAVTAAETRAVTPAQASRTEAFTVTFPAPPATGGTVNLNAAARDASGNTGTAAGLTLQVRDVVAPMIASITPAAGATNVDPNASPNVVFSEPMLRATVTSGIRLTANGSPVPATLTMSPDDRTVTLTPSAALAINTVYTIAVDATVTDRAGNALATATASTFRTSTPDATRPHVEAIDPPDNATGVATTAPVQVTFSEAIDPATVTPASFRALVDGAAVAGTFAFVDGGRVVRFDAAAPWPFESVVAVELSPSIADTAGNTLGNAAGAPLTSPLTFTFLTGNFAITSPAGASVVERTVVALTARASAALDVTSVVFSVNGTALPAVTTAPFTTPFIVPPAATTATVSIVASARNAQNVEVARAEKTVAVVDGLQVAPGVLGLPRGATRALRFSLARPAAEDVPIALSAGDAQAVTLESAQLVLPAGQTSLTVNVTACTTCPWDPAAQGRAAVSTAVAATSSRGAVSAAVSVSDPVAGQSVSAIAGAAGVSAPLPPSAGHAFTASGRTTTTTVVLLPEALEGTAPLDVTITSSNPAVATATVSPIRPGERTATITITAVGNGVAVLTLRAGSLVRSFTVYVGPQPAGLSPLVLGAPVGIAIPQPASAGQVITAAGQVSVLALQVLAAPLAPGAPAPVTISSSNPAVATATAADVQPGSQVTAITVTHGNGVAVLTIRVGNEVRSFTVRVGAPSASETPMVLASPVGISVAPLPFIGGATAPTGTTFTIGILLLAEPAAATTTVAVTSSNPAVAFVNGVATIAAGSRMAVISVTTGAAGRVTLTLDTGTLRREFSLFVGSAPPPGQTPVITAAPVGVSVVPLPAVSRLMVAPGAPVNASVGIQLLTAPRATATPVSVTTSNPALVRLAAGAATTGQIAAGSTVLPLDLFTAGTEGAVLIRFTLDGEAREMVVVVGNPPASQVPAVTAPVVGLRITP